MSRGTDLLLKLLDQQWSTPSWPTVPQSETLEAAEEEMVIMPDTEHGPMLRITQKGKGKDSTAVFVRKLNLAAVDDLIGKLIKTRDHMATMKGNDDA